MHWISRGGSVMAIVVSQSCGVQSASTVRMNNTSPEPDFEIQRKCLVELHLLMTWTDYLQGVGLAVPRDTSQLFWDKLIRL